MNTASATAAYLDRLNPEQRRAVEYGDPELLRAGPLLIIAGAGSGKTNTLAHRVAPLLVKGIDPRCMLLLTFSRRAAAEMCAGCHLAPGRKQSELRDALYPKPPDLTARFQATAAEEFWVIKHGIKMSAMPAWGVTHDDSVIWAIVAFVRKLPDLTPERYQALAGTSEEPEHHHHSHSHN